MSGKGLSGWKILGILVCGGLLCGSLLVSWIVSRRSARMKQSVQELTERLKLRNPKRAVLYGTPLPGDASTDYRLAEAEIRRSEDFHQLRQGLETMSPTTFALMDEAHRDEEVLDLLHSGALRETASDRDDWYHEAPLSLCTVALLDARRAAEEGRSAQALERVLDICRYGSDVAESQGHIGMVVLQWGFGESRAQVRSGSLDNESLLRLQRGLKILDDSFPSVERDFLRWARFHARGGGVQKRSSVTDTLLEKESVYTYHDLYSRAADSVRPEWALEQKNLKDVDNMLSVSINPWARNSVIHVEWTARYYRHLRAQLRLLWVASAFLGSGELLDLEDPFGGRVKTAQAGGALKVWSVGGNGIDDGGIGDWGLKSLDIVLEVKR
jgi:hypothetical protein